MTAKKPPKGMIRCSPAEECPFGDNCLRLSSYPDPDAVFREYGPPKKGTCNFFINKSRYAQRKGR